MKKSLIAALIASAVAVPTVAMAEDSPHTFTANVGVVSDYLFRGVSQTHGDPALQGGVDYSHASGFYAGAWASTIQWVDDAQNRSVPLEFDLYGGFKGAFATDWTYDLGLIAYMYPGSKDTQANASAKADTQELYAAIGWKFLTLKYSYAISSHFIGWYGGDTTAGEYKNTRGSDYIELNANYDLGDGWGLIGHVGHQRVNNFGTPGYTSPNYTDWKLGVSKDLGFGVLALTYSDTTVDGTCGYTGGTNPYCWASWDGGQYKDGRNAATGRGVLSFVKTF